MAGGTWIRQNKVRPGVYINFVSEPKPIGAVGERGIATMALPLPWGPAKTVLTVEAGADTTEVLGHRITAPELLLIRESLKRARTLLLYRLNTGTKATATLDSLTVTAKYGGIRGNDITVAIQENIDDESLFDVRTLVDGFEVDFQTVADIAGLTSNPWVDFSGTGLLSETAGLPLTDGADGDVTNQDHMDYLAAIELYDFNTMALVSEDVDLKAVYTAFVRRLREDEGKKVQVVLENYPLAHFEGVISVKNGVILADGTTLTAAQATAWVAGATAGADVSESLTYQAYDDAVDAVPRYTNTQIIAALQAGEFLFTHSDGRALVEQDINTLIDYTLDKGKQFSKNRVIRVLDGIANDFKRIFEQFYVGKVDNNADGRNLLKNECNSYLAMLQGISVIQNFDAQADVTITQGVESDSVYIEAHVQPVDSVEKIYMKVQVS